MGISSTTTFSMASAGAEAVLEHGAGVQVAQLGLDERAQVAGGAVLHLEDQVELIVVLDDHARTHLSGGNRHREELLTGVRSTREREWALGLFLILAYSRVGRGSANSRVLPINKSWLPRPGSARAGSRRALKRTPGAGGGLRNVPSLHARHHGPGVVDAKDVVSLVDEHVVAGKKIFPQQPIGAQNPVPAHFSCCRPGQPGWWPRDRRLRTDRVSSTTPVPESWRPRLSRFPSVADGDPRPA